MNRKNLREYDRVGLEPGPVFEYYTVLQELGNANTLFDPDVAFNDEWRTANINDWDKNIKSAFVPVFDNETYSIL